MSIMFLQLRREYRIKTKTKYREVGEDGKVKSIGQGQSEKIPDGKRLKLKKRHK